MNLLKFTQEQREEILSEIRTLNPERALELEEDLHYEKNGCHSSDGSTWNNPGWIEEAMD